MLDRYNKRTWLDLESRGLLMRRLYAAEYYVKDSIGRNYMQDPLGF